VTVLDITNPAQPVQLTAQVTSDAASKTDYALRSASAMVGNQLPLHTLHGCRSRPDLFDGGIHQNHPSHWHSAQPGSEIVMISPGAFAGALDPLLHAHKAEGKSARSC
jgi:hypothetical protein